MRGRSCAKLLFKNSISCQMGTSNIFLLALQIFSSVLGADPSFDGENAVRVEE